MPKAAMTLRNPDPCPMPLITGLQEAGKFEVAGENSRLCNLNGQAGTMFVSSK